MWDGVPWFVTGTAASPETLRMVLDAAVGGEGVVGPADLVVTALEMPADAVQVGTGAMVAREPGAGQAYAARMPTVQSVDIEVAGADGPRSDLIVARIEDPYGGQPWPEPEDPLTGPYVHTRVITDVPPGTTTLRAVDDSSTAVVLARVDLPAGATQVTDAMVTDLRQIARPRQQEEDQYLTGWTAPDDVGPVTDAWEEFPLGGTWTERAPEWATHVTVRCTLTGLLHPDAVEARGQIRVVCGEQGGLAVPYAATAPGRLALQAGQRFALSPEERGQLVSVGVQGRGEEGFSGVLRADTASACHLAVRFEQRPVSA
ncbi:hypothetical protein ACIQU7_23525 [Streptomyces albidoflavus]